MRIAFHIGYHKTGSTWLQQVYFRQHPRIHLIIDYLSPWTDPLLSCLIAVPDRKFDPCLCRYMFRGQTENVDGHADDVLMISCERLSGHPFCGGYDDVRIAERIFTCWPEARVLCVVRDQVEMIESVYRQLVREGYPGNIESLFRSSNWKGVGFDLNYFEYDWLIRKYKTLFGMEHLCVLPYEMMSADLNGFIGEICQFLSVPPEPIRPEMATCRVNGSLSVAGSALLRSLNHFRKSELNPFPTVTLFETPGKQMSPFKNVMVRSLMHLSPQRTFISGKMEQQLRTYYQTSNRRLIETLKENFLATAEIIETYL